MSTEPEQPSTKALSGVKGAAVTTAQFMLNPKAWLDWRGWLLGLYSSSVTAFAEAATGWMGTNGLEGTLGSVPVQWVQDASHGIGISFKSAVVLCLFRALTAAMKYISLTKGLPPQLSSPPFSSKPSNDEKS